MGLMLAKAHYASRQICSIARCINKTVLTQHLFSVEKPCAFCLLLKVFQRFLGIVRL